jgi:pyrroloquinoline-quinone synthase
MENVESVLRRIDARIAERSILAHPFYQAWTAGTLTRGDLAVYARVYYPHVAAFPSHLRAAAAGATLGEVRAEIEANLREEEGVPRPHAELWQDFAAGMGADRAALEQAPATPAAARTVDTFARLCGNSSTAALCALYAYESQQPEVSVRKQAGLREHYGIDDERTLAYFGVHAEADLRHRAGERRAIAACLAADDSAEEALAATEQALDAYWQLLDGVVIDIEAGGGEKLAARCIPA